ncbi:MAG: phosphoribosylaminoimidazolesuccinocarboxamide synthase [bacterium]|nr:phosphoribosylaminoimidazolesuccinocarboxamide synthase [bacterium]
MEKKEKLYDGKSKTLYATDKQDALLLEFKDDVASLNASKKGKIKNKGSMNSKISAQIFKYLSSYNVRTHFIQEAGDNGIFVKKLEPILIRVVMRNIASGDLCEKFNLEEGSELSSPILEMYYKNDDLGNPLINEYHAYSLQIATQEDIKQMAKYALKINAVLKSFFHRRKFKLIDFTIEFAKNQDDIVLADEISPDTFTVLDVNSNIKYDKAFYLKDLGKSEKIYNELLDRMME